DHTGVIRAAYANAKNFTNPLLAEAAALLAGIRTAIDLKFDNVVYNGLIRSISNWETSLFPRQANFGAHNLAKWCSQMNVLGSINCSLLPLSLVCMDSVLP
ncbi:hypothetical protein TorRG33x02_062050, partial [Trema orientale]